MMKRLTIDIDDKEHQELKVKSAQEGKTIREILVELIRNFLRKK
ncbi:hypothetical protein ACFL2G_00745 [Candidatus Omnitrophota bacterium]